MNGIRNTEWFYANAVNQKYIVYGSFYNIINSGSITNVKVLPKDSAQGTKLFERRDWHMTKEQEIMAYLHEKVFDPVLNSKTASKKLKSGVNLTIARLNNLTAEKMVHYYWSAVSGTDRSIGFAKLMKDENFMRFEEVLEEFREKFNDKWLRS